MKKIILKRKPALTLKRKPKKPSVPARKAKFTA